MFDVIFKGTFHIKDFNAFMQDFQQLLNKHKVIFSGQIVNFPSDEFTDYEELKE